VKTFVALLRGVNLAGKRTIAMAELRDVASDLGHAHVRTVLQSGNLVFRSSGATAAKLEMQLEAAIAKRFGHPVDVFVRDAAAWERLIEENPYPREARDDPAHLLLMCLKRASSAGADDRLAAAITGPEYGRVRGANAYLVYPDGIGTSKLTAAKLEKALGCSGSARNWNTVIKLRDAASTGG
jgi:uncharacterized protein (DUF1697 family)